MVKIIDVCPVSRNKRVTLPSQVMEKLNLESCSSSILFTEIDGKIIITNADAEA